MFSPIVPMASLMVSATDLPVSGKVAAETASTEPSVDRATVATPSTSRWKESLRATKSVSELSSTTTASVPSAAMPIRPSAAVRPDFLSALEMPLARSQSIAASMSPFVSESAFLQSIMPAPVLSRSSFTCAAEIVMFAS